jgi:hypothetical protein
LGSLAFPVGTTRAAAIVRSAWTDAMSRYLYLALAAGSALLVGCVVAPYPYPSHPTTVVTPPSFDRSWDAALGAAADAGVQVTRADRATGRITGTKAGAAVTIDLRPQADNTLQ